ncbi:ankyrin repeat-containing domain protein [Morchella snyderi]|nr:ankyrin repeat-containing domain protein [Morchella snyderi]
MSFSDLPNELVIEIALLLSTAGDFKRFVCVNRSIFILLKPLLFKKFAQKGGNFIIALYLSAITRNVENICILLEDQRSEIKYPYTNTNGQASMLNELLTKTADTDRVAAFFIKYHRRSVIVDNTYGRSPLFWAMVEERHDLFTKLLNMGVGMNVRDHRGQTPLFWAVRKGPFETCRRLLNAGAIMSRRDVQHKFTPLHAAVYYRSINMVRLVLRFSLNVNARSRVNRGTVVREFSPLIIAVQKGRKDIIKLLLENGADPHSFTAEPAALDLLCECGTDSYTSSGLIEYMPSPLRYAIIERKIDILELFLDGKVDSLDYIGATSLQHAACDHDPTVSVFLLSMGADPDHTGWRGYTALKQAAIDGCVFTIQALLNGGANINACCKRHGRTALHWAVIKSGNAEPSIGVLLERGIDTGIRDLRGMTAMDYAMEMRYYRAFLKIDISEGLRRRAKRCVYLRSR